MRLDTIHSLIIVAMVALATQITRWTPFLLFSGDKKLPKVVEDLGRLLPPAMMGLLVVYSLRSTDLLGGSHGIPEAIAVAVTAGCTCGGGTRCCPSWRAPPAICCWYSWCFEDLRKRRPAGRRFHIFPQTAHTTANAMFARCVSWT